MAALAPYAGQPSSAEVSRHLATVLRAPQLSGLDHRNVHGGQSLLGQLGNFLLTLIRDLYHAAGPLTWILAAGVVLIALLVLAAWRLRAERGGLQPQSTAQPTPGEHGPGLRPERLFAEAEALLRQGRTREAVRLSFQALLLSVPPRAVPFDPSWTNSELVSRASRAAGLRGALAPIVQEFDVVVYGGRDLGPDASAAFAAACRRTAARMTG